jgi:hypothetical protein
MIVRLSEEQILLVCQGLSRFEDDLYAGRITINDEIKRDPKSLLKEIRSALTIADYALDYPGLTAQEALLLHYALCFVTEATIPAEILVEIGTFDLKGLKADITKKLDAAKFK